MPTVRLAVASTPLTATLDEAVPAAIAAVEEAGRLGAHIVCLPETGLPGHRLQSRHVPDVTQDELDRAVDAVAAAAGHARVVTIVGAERLTPAGREIVSVVLDADGTRLGEQAKTQIDPGRGAALRRRQRTANLHRRRTHVRDRDLPRGVSLPGDRARSCARRRAGRVRPALRDYRGWVAARALVRRLEPVRGESAAVPGAREHRLRRAGRTSPARIRGRRPASSRRTARSSRRWPTARSAWRPPMSTSPSPTASWPGAGRRSATVWPIRCSGSRSVSFRP